jgi:hypothetical protein
MASEQTLLTGSGQNKKRLKALNNVRKKCVAIPKVDLLPC